MMQPDRDHELERELRELGANIEYPPTPDLPQAVRSRLDAEPRSRVTRRWRPGFSMLSRVAAAAAFLIIVAAPILSPAVRDTLGGLFVSGRETGQATGDAGEASPADAGDRAHRAPPEEQREAGGEAAEPASGGPVMPPSAGGERHLGEGLGLGDRISLREAQKRGMEGDLLLPETPGLGKPDEVYAGGASGEIIVLVYRAGPGLPSLGRSGIGLVLTQSPGRVEAAYLGGRVSAAAEMEQVSVGGGRGYWVPADRSVSLPVERTDGLRGGVLLWEEGGMALRLEADISRHEAIHIAESVRRSDTGN